MVKRLHTIADLRQAMQAERLAGQSIGLVPTMGNLHDGHISLAEQMVAKVDCTIASIFVNPLQFGAGEDLDAYPRTLDEDCARLDAAGCSYVFAPSVAEIYPKGQNRQTIVEVPGLSDHLCGASRPGHFQGVATVVAKLFNLVQPDKAIFGKKDFQQLAVIRRMAADLCFPIDILGGETIRAEDGLALSSRNGYLTPDERAIAPRLYAVLLMIADELKRGNRSFDVLEEAGNCALDDLGFKRDYVAIRNPETLAAPDMEDTEFVILAAAKLGKARLIDNMEVWA